MKYLLIGLLVAAAAVGGYFAFGGNGAGEPASVTGSGTPAPSGTTPPPDPAPASPSETKEFSVSGTNFEFSPKEIRVKKGDRVRVTFRNETGTHDWRLDEFDAATDVLRAGEQEIVEFTAHEAGTFEYYCSVGAHRQMGMVGNLIVEE